MALKTNIIDSNQGIAGTYSFWWILIFTKSN